MTNDIMAFVISFSDGGKIGPLVKPTNGTNPLAALYKKQFLFLVKCLFYVFLCSAILIYNFV